MEYISDELRTAVLHRFLAERYMTRQRYRDVFYSIAKRGDTVFKKKVTPEMMIKAINQKINQYGFSIEPSHNEVNGVVCFAFVNTKDDAVAREQKGTDPAAYDTFRVLLAELIDKGHISSLAMALQIAKAAAPQRSERDTEAAIRSLSLEGWLTWHENKIYLGPLGSAELDGLLRQDVLAPVCETCNKVVLHGTEEALGKKYHMHCAARSVDNVMTGLDVPFNAASTVVRTPMCGLGDMAASAASLAAGVLRTGEHSESAAGVRRPTRRRSSGAASHHNAAAVSGGDRGGVSESKEPEGLHDQANDNARHTKPYRNRGDSDNEANDPSAREAELASRAAVAAIGGPKRRRVRKISAAASNFESTDESNDS